MSIKVGVRVRPFNSREKDRESVCIIEMNGNQTKIKDELDQEKTFTFDQSFWSHDSFIVNDKGYFEAEDEKYADQTIVFNAVGKEILDNAWEGYHCCLFAYGQTGSGKSYSMVGYGANKGIVPISCEEIFTRIKENSDPEKGYEVQVSMLEIYNEKVQDLLMAANKRPQAGLKVRESKVLGIFVEGLTKYPVTSYEEISQKMDQGYENRTIGSTLMNATSSRAHTIVTIEFKQITIIAGKKSEKLSMINLVDLAGSERAGSTGATGDRLKEGCNINKSLLVLGNVINTLADKATGKKKDLLPPYRDSSLTRILQNALGGNSKTVMICALSPASINYEETLSTLRYADRAKKIQNKAVVNESEHDKMVRMLKEENGDLKKMLEDLEKKIMGGGVSSASDQQEMSNIKEQYEANRRVMEDMEKTFTERVEEAKIKDKESLGEKVDISAPHLIVLNEDPQLSHKLKYSLKKLPVFVGRKHGNPPPLIILSGIGIKQNHAVFLQDKDNIRLKPNDKEAKDYIFINGKKLTDIEGIVLNPKDRITFGTNTIVIYMDKSSGSDIYENDWESAQIELHKAIEEDEKRQEEENEKKKQEEVIMIKKDLEEKLSKEKTEIEEKYKQEMQAYQDKLKEINQNDEKMRIENERKNIERLLKEKIDNIEMEKAKKRRDIEQREQCELIRKSTSKINIDSLRHNTAKLHEKVMIILKKLQKMKIIISELKRNINIEVIVQKHLIDNTILYHNDSHPERVKPYNILLRVSNYELGTVYYWTTETFFNRYDLMKELFNKYTDDNEMDILNLKNKDDPLWDDVSPTLLGYAFYLLEPMSYLMTNFSSLSVITPGGKMIGNLNVDVIPHDQQGNEYEEAPEQPDDLIGQTLLYRVYIKECCNFNGGLCKEIYVEYEDGNSVITRTQKCKVDNGKVIIEESFEHKIDYLTREDIAYFNREKLIFRVFGYETVDVKGKITKEEINETFCCPLKVNGSMMKINESMINQTAIVNNDRHVNILNIKGNAINLKDEIEKEERMEKIAHHHHHAKSPRKKHSKSKFDKKEEDNDGCSIY